MMDASFTEIRRIFKSFLNERNSDEALNVDEDSTDYRRLLKAASVRFIETLEIDRRRDLGDYSAVIAGPVNESLQQAPSATRQTAPYPVKASSLKLSVVIDEYIEHQKQDLNRRGLETITEREQCCKRLLYIVGDKPIAEYTVDDFQNYAVILSRLPVNLNKGKAYVGKSLKQILEMNLDGKTLGVATRVKHIQSVKGLFEWAKKKEFIDRNRAEIIDNPVEHRSKQKPRIAFSSDDLKTMVSNYSKEVQGGLMKKSRPERFWVPLIAAYSGMRMNEICQLRVSDVHYDGISESWYFNVFEEVGETKVKNKSSIRKVPIHSALISVGFLEYLSKVKSVGAERLWPSLKADAKGKFSRPIANWFNGSTERPGFNRRLITDDSRKTFHSYRHTLRNELKQVGADKDISYEIVGHEYEEGEGGTYTDAYEIFVKLKELEKVTYGGLDLSPLKEIAAQYI